MRESRSNGSLSRRPFLAGVGALALGVIAGCGSDDSKAPSGSGSSGTTTITVGVIPIVDVAPVYLGIQQGFFASAGLNLKLQTAQGGAVIVPSVLSGQFQFGFSNTTSLLLAASKGLPLKVVSSGVASTGQIGKDFGAVVVRNSSPIKSAADLAGKRIAVNTLNNINTTTVNRVVAKAGADPSKITYVELAFPDIAPAVAKGDVDAGQVVEPFLTIATQQGDRQVVSNLAGTDPDLTVGMYFTTASYAQKNAAVVTKFVTAMTKSMQYASDNPDAVRKILSTYTKIEPAVQEALILPRWPAQIDQGSVETLADLAVHDGLFDTKPDLTALLP
ncbi:MAG TPA: ABC transporter substrate-binding protein [Kineosporiaceae bacterium]|nr:ABC transporter substrate-binding protein [Kineosporiaceae bacterium]